MELDWGQIASHEGNGAVFWQTTGMASGTITLNGYPFIRPLSFQAGHENWIETGSLPLRAAFRNVDSAWRAESDAPVWAQVAGMH